MIVVDTDVLIEMLEKNRNGVYPLTRNWNRAVKLGFTPLTSGISKQCLDFSYFEFV